MKVIVVGGGIMGLSVAWALQRRGLMPVVYEQGPIPNPLGSSFDHSRQIRYAYGPMTGYGRMVREAFEAWQLLWLDLGCRHYIETGTLVIARRDPAFVRASRDLLDDLGLPFEELSADEIERRYPFCQTDGIRAALLSPTAGLLLADLILDDLAAHLRGLGYTVLETMPVRELDPARAAVTLADGRKDQGDALVVAAGPWTARLLPDYGKRLTPSRQVAVYLDPPTRHLAIWQRAPVLLDDLEAKDGGFYAMPPFAGHGVKIGDHGFSLKGDPDREREATAEDVEAILKLARGRLVDLDLYRFARARTCFYTVTENERFIAETVDKALVLAGFSGHGFKFGPLLGLAAARMLDSDLAPEALRAYAAAAGPGQV